MFSEQAGLLRSRSAVRVLAHAALHGGPPQLLSQLLGWQPFVAPASTRLDALEELLDRPLPDEARDEVLQHIAEVISRMPRAIETDLHLGEMFGRFLRRRPPLIQFCLHHIWPRLTAPDHAVKSHTEDLMDGIKALPRPERGFWLRQLAARVFQPMGV